MAQQVADELDSEFKTQIPTWASQPVDVDRVGEPRVSMRMLRLKEQVGDDYERSAEAAVQEQLTKAGARLATVLNSVWPSPESAIR